MLDLIVLLHSWNVYFIVLDNNKSPEEVRVPPLENFYIKLRLGEMLKRGFVRPNLFVHERVCIRDEVGASFRWRFLHYKPVVSIHDSTHLFLMLFH